jgi:glycosyltransferase involved in cell wall biosynthesis
MQVNLNKSIVLGVDTRDLRIAQTGARTYLTELIHAWQQMPGVQLVLLDNARGVYRGKNKGLKLLEHLRFFWWKQVQLPLLARHKGVTHLFCSDFFVPYFKMGIKTIAVLHDAFFWESPEHYHPFWLQLFHGIGVPAAKRANLLIVPTEQAKKSILKHENFDPNKMQVVLEAAKSFHEPIIGPRPFDAPYFLHVGVLEKRKNIERLVEAFAKLHAMYPNYKLVLVGNTPVKAQLNDAPAIEQAIESLGLQEAVVRLGYLEADALATVYTHAFAYCLPSLNEGFGLPILEAFHFKLPLICANTSALPEVAGDAALYMDPYDPVSMASAMSQLVESPSLVNQLVEKGQARQLHFSWSKAAQEIHELMKGC